MSRVAEAFDSIREKPFIAVEFVQGIILIVYGGILLSPYYEVPAGSVNSVLGSPLIGHLIAIMYVSVGATAVWACYHPSVRNRNVSTRLLFAAFFFTTLIRLLTVGFLPLLWLWTLLLAAIAIIDNWNIKWKPSPGS